MSNMSYCRFENTHGDLRDCVEAIEDGEKLSQSELDYAEAMYDLCQRYMTAYRSNPPKLEEDEEEEP